MKSPLLFILAVALALAPVAGAQDSRQADYFLNNPEKRDGSRITLSCSHVKRLPTPVESGKDVNFWAYTASRSDYKSALSSSPFLPTRQTLSQRNMALTENTALGTK